jgi:hypothetical protein
VPCSSSLPCLPADAPTSCFSEAQSQTPAAPPLCCCSSSAAAGHNCTTSTTRQQDRSMAQARVSAPLARNKAVDTAATLSLYLTVAQSPLIALVPRCCCCCFLSHKQTLFHRPAAVTHSPCRIFPACHTPCSGLPVCRPLMHLSPAAAAAATPAPNIHTGLLTFACPAATAAAHC